MLVVVLLLVVLVVDVVVAVVVVVVGGGVSGGAVVVVVVAGGGGGVAAIFACYGYGARIQESRAAVHLCMSRCHRDNISHQTSHQKKHHRCQKTENSRTLHNSHGLFCSKLGERCCYIISLITSLTLQLLISLPMYQIITTRTN